MTKAVLVMNRPLYCACCGQKIENHYLKVLDNFLQAKYFDESDGSDNIFCSDECLKNALSVEEFFLEEEND